MAYRGNGGGGRRGAGGSGGDSGGRPSPPPSTPRPVLMGGYHGLMVLQHKGAYGVLMASDQPSGQVAVFRAAAPAPPQYSISSAAPESPITALPPTTSPASPTSTPAPPRQPALQSAFSTPSSEPALAKEVKKNLFVSETALARPAAAAQGTAAAGGAGVDASDLDPAPVSNKGLAHTARLGLATVGKDVMIRGNPCYGERKALRIRRESPALAAHLQTSPYNADGGMEYCLEPTELAEVRRQAGVSDPYWVPPPPGRELTKEINGVKGRMEQLTCKDDVDFDAESAYNEKNQCAARANEKLEKQVIFVKDTCENVVKMNGELKKVSFMEHILDMKLEEHITYLSNSFLSFKDQLVLALEMETERQLELAPSEAVPRPVLYVGSGEQMIPRTDGTVIQGGQDRPLRKSSFHVSKPQGTFLWPSMASRGFRMFSTSNKPDDSDLKPLFDAIGPVQNSVHWPLNGPDICERFDDLIGHLRLYDAVHGQALDVSDMLGDEKIVYTTALEGTQYVKVSYTKNGKDYWFKLIVDAREGWNYGWQNKYGTFEYKDSASNPYIVGSMHLDFKSDYGAAGVCSKGHGNVLMGRAAVRASCMVIAEYDGRTPAPHQVRMACALFLNYILESMKFHHAYYFNRLSLMSSGTLCTLHECEPALPLLVKRWSKLGGPLITFLTQQLQFPPDRMLKVKGIEYLEPLHEAIAIVPFNSLQAGSKTRTWRYFAEDVSNNGQAHCLSRDFLKKWPFHRDVALLRSPRRKENVSAAWRWLPKVNLAKDSIANNMKIIEPAASRHNRFGLKPPSCHARRILHWTLKGIR